MLMPESSPASDAPRPGEPITDEMLVRMVVLILKDIAKLAPYLDRISIIAANAESPLFKNATDDPRIAHMAQTQRVVQVKAFAGLLNLLIVNQMSGMKFVLDVSDAQRKAAVDKAMKDLGIES